MYLYGLEDEEKFFFKYILIIEDLPSYPNFLSNFDIYLNSLSTKKQANQNKDIFTTLLCFS